MTEPSQYFKGRTVQEQMDEVIGYVDTRAAEVATTAIASDVAQVHQDMLDADADAQAAAASAAAAAASAAAAAGTLANAVKKTGEASQSIAGDIAVAGTLSGGVVTGTQVTVPTPVNNTDAATKKYVDDADALKLNITDVNTVAVGLTGNQSMSGVKTTTSNIVGKYYGASGIITSYGFVIAERDTSQDVVANPTINRYFPPILFEDGNGNRVGGLRIVHNTNGTCSLIITLRNADGTNKNITLATSDP